jgi:hypothetical protein
LQAKFILKEKQVFYFNIIDEKYQGQMQKYSNNFNFIPKSGGKYKLIDSIIKHNF